VCLVNIMTCYTTRIRLLWEAAQDFVVDGTVLDEEGESVFRSGGIRITLPGKTEQERARLRALLTVKQGELREAREVAAAAKV
jgi:hypothetical protein